MLLNPFCPSTTAKVLALKATVLLLLTLLIKARVQIVAGSALGIFLLPPQTLVFLAITWWSRGGSRRRCAVRHAAAPVGSYIIDSRGYWLNHDELWGAPAPDEPHPAIRPLRPQPC